MKSKEPQVSRLREVALKRPGNKVDAAVPGGVTSEWAAPVLGASRFGAYQRYQFIARKRTASVPWTSKGRIVVLFNSSWESISMPIGSQKCNQLMKMTIAPA